MIHKGLLGALIHHIVKAEGGRGGVWTEAETCSVTTDCECVSVCVRLKNECCA